MSVTSLSVYSFIYSATFLPPKQPFSLPNVYPRPFVPVSSPPASPISPAVDHVIPEPGSSLMEAYDQWRQWADEKACCDYSFHVDITHWNDSVKQELDHLIKEKGIGSAWRTALRLVFQVRI